MWTRRVGALLAFALTALASCTVPLLLVRNPTRLDPLVYLWAVLPVFFAAAPLRWPRLEKPAAGLLIVYILLPFSLSIGIFYVPGAIALTISALTGSRHRNSAG